MTSFRRNNYVIVTIPNVSAGIGARVYELPSQRKESRLRAVSFWCFTFTVSFIQSNRAYSIVGTCLNCPCDCHCNVKGPGHKQLWSEYHDFTGIRLLMQVPITYAWVEYMHQPETLKHCHKYMSSNKRWESRDPASNLRNMKQSSQTCNKKHLKVDCLFHVEPLQKILWIAFNAFSRNQCCSQTDKPTSTDKNITRAVPQR